MRRATRFITFWAALWACAAAGKPAIEPGDFAYWYHAFLAHRVAPASPAKQRTRDIHYVFVAGFLNEGNPRYFQDNIAELLRIGVPRRSIHVIYPPSAGSVETNSEFVQRTLADLPGRLVLIGHSKGAVEALALAVHHPDFVQRRVEMIFLVQGAFGGSGIADYLLGKGVEPDYRMGLTDRWLFASWRRGVPFLGRWINGGLTSLATEESRAYWREKLAGRREAADAISDRVYFIRGSKPASRTSAILGPTARYLATYYGVNDGLVLKSDQHVDGIGTDLLEMEADHADPVVPWPVSNTSAALRAALTETIFSAVNLALP